MARRLRRKRNNHSAHHGGNWKVAYADFVTALMALFLVLWLVAQGDQKLKIAIASYFRDPGVFDTAKGNIFRESGEGTQNGEGKPSTIAAMEDLKALNSAAALLRQKISGMGNRDRVRVEMSDEGLHIQILDKADHASFPSGSAELEPTTREILADIARVICEVPNLIQIGGHTDSYTFPNSNYTNWELSADRANAARRELENDCVKPERIRRIVGYADMKPLVVDDPFAPANRRISITLFFQKATEPILPDNGQEATTAPETDKPEKDKPATAKPEEPAPEIEKPKPAAPMNAQRSTLSQPSSSKTPAHAAPVNKGPVDLRLEERARRVQKAAPVKETFPRAAAGQTQ